MVPTSSARSEVRRIWPRRVAWMLVTIGLLFALAWFTLTDSRPSVGRRPPPDAAEVGAARSAAEQLRTRMDGRQPSNIELGRAQLDGISALVSHGFRPDRLAIGLDGGIVSVRGSHRLPGGRWFNASIDSTGGRGFPPIALRIGSVSLGPRLSRVALRAGLSVLRWRGIDLPPIEEIVRNVAVRRDRVSAVISIPNITALVDGLAGTASQPIDAREVVGIYCRLAEFQVSAPGATLPDLIHRTFAFSAGDAASREYNHAAFVALAMLVVDERVGDLAGTARSDSSRCRAPTAAVTLQGRPDWAKHWSLSAALAVGAGTQLSEAMGEWKELADSLDAQAQFALGDPSGFSFADLAADRSGFRTARAATSERGALPTAEWLRSVTAEQLLPGQLTLREDGIANAEFVRRYGSLTDARFARRLGEIDQTLDRTGMPGQ